MNKKAIAAPVAVVVLVAAAVAYRHGHERDPHATRAELLALLPGDGTTAVYLDFSELRKSPFLAQLLALAPEQAPEGDYAQFMRATGFNYERDLERLAISIDRQAQTKNVFAVAEARFDRKKIEGYAAEFGALPTADGKTLYAVPIGHSPRKAYFTFLRDDRVLWANDSSYFFQQGSRVPAAEWREHFARVSGTPIFVILRQDAEAARALSTAPGGIHSPQLATLISQLQWISIGGKPEGDFLRVVIDAEARNENVVRQLQEVLGGLLAMAQLGLNDPKTRKQLDPELREGYLDLLNSSEIQQLDRGTSKSVRVVFEVTPKLLRGAARKANANEPAAGGRTP